MTGLFIGFLVEKCVTCYSRKSDFGWRRFVFHFASCVRRCKSLKRFWPYLIVFRSCISNGKPEQLFYLMFVFFISNFMKSRTVYASSSYTFVRVETVIWPSMRFDIHSKSERSVLALKTGPFRWVKYSPIFGSNLAPLNQGQYSPVS